MKNNAVIEDLFSGFRLDFAHSAWTDVQMVAQLNSGYTWFGSTITYSFQTSLTYMEAGANEKNIFIALNTTAQPRASLALAMWDDSISSEMTQIAQESTTNIEFEFTLTDIGYVHAYYPTYGSVWFNSSYKSGTNNLVKLLIGRHLFITYEHEIGHALGLNHAGEYNGLGSWTPSNYKDSTLYTIMSYFGPSGEPVLGRVKILFAGQTGSEQILSTIRRKRLCYWISWHCS